MAFKDKLVKFLTPKHTEEIKPNLFIQQIKKDDDLIMRLEKTVKGHKHLIVYPEYRKITPVAWNGRIINYIAFWLGANPIKSTLVFLLILFIAWSYTSDISNTHEFYNNIIYNSSYGHALCSATWEEEIAGGSAMINKFNLTQYCIEKWGKITGNLSNVDDEFNRVVTNLNEEKNRGTYFGPR